jgi:integrase
VKNNSVKFKDEIKKRPYNKVDRATGAVTVREYPNWYGRWRPVGAKNWTWHKLYRDKQASIAEWRRFQTREERRASGVSSEAIDRLDLPVPRIKEQYIAAQRLRGRSDDHVRITDWVLTWTIEWADWKVWKDITVASMSKVLERLKADDRTVAYRNDFIKKAKAFVNWSLPPGWPDPLDGLHRISTKGAKQRRGRRAASLDEIKALLALNIPHNRRLAYALALLDGLRRIDGLGLTWGDVFLNAPIPYVRLKPKQANAVTREWDYIPIHPYVLSLLDGLDAGTPEQHVLASIPDIKTLKKDLERARFEMKNSAGERLDYHALRHTFTTWLGRKGCSRATRKKLTRHANDDVTDGYAHAELAEMLEALVELPSPLTWGEDVARATGTDGVAGTASHRSHAGHGVVSGGHGPSSFGKFPMTGTARLLPLEIVALCTAGQGAAQRDLNQRATPDIVAKTRPSTQVD